LQTFGAQAPELTGLILVLKARRSYFPRLFSKPGYKQRR